MNEPKPDMVNGPKHYRGDRVMRIIEEFGLGFKDGNVIKYVLRYPEKGGVEDLKKARWYLDRLIAEKDGVIDPTEPEPATDFDTLAEGDTISDGTIILDVFAKPDASSITIGFGNQRVTMTRDRYVKGGWQKTARPKPEAEFDLLSIADTIAQASGPHYVVCGIGYEGGSRRDFSHRDRIGVKLDPYGKDEVPRCVTRGDYVRDGWRKVPDAKPVDAAPAKPESDFDSLSERDEVTDGRSIYKVSDLFGGRSGDFLYLEDGDRTFMTNRTTYVCDGWRKVVKPNA